MKKIKRFLSLLLAIVMVLTSAPIDVHAEETSGSTTTDDAQTEAENLALNKPVVARYTADETNAVQGGGTAFTGEGGSYPMSRVTDGDIPTGTSGYTDFGSSSSKSSSYLQIDLQEICEIQSVKIWCLSGRTYNEIVVAAAEKETDFVNYNSHPEKVTIFHNGDNANVHGFGEGTDEDLADSGSGNEYTKEDESGTIVTSNARFVRVYMYGHTGASTGSNHVQEVQVLGYKLAKQPIELSVGETVEVEGAITDSLENQEVVSVVTSLTAPYTELTENDSIVSGESYLLGKTTDSGSYIVTGVKQGDERANGFKIVNSADLNAGDYSAYSWRITGDDTNGYAMMNNATGMYMGFVDKNADNNEVKLKTSEEIVSISRSGEYFLFKETTIANKEVYLHDFGSSHTHAAGYPSPDGDASKWNLYTGTEKVKLTGKTVGSTNMTIGGTAYEINVTGDVKEVNVSINKDESISLINNEGVYNTYQTADGGEGIVQTDVGLDRVQITSADALELGKEYLILPDRGSANYPAVLTSQSNADNRLELLDVRNTDITTDAPRWKIEQGENDTSKYTISKESKYLNIGDGTASAGIKAELELACQDNVWTIKGTEYLNRWGGESALAAGGYETGYSDAGSRWQLWKTGTAITFTGTAAGYTTVTVGNIQYHILVKEAGTRPLDGTTTDQPFDANTGGSANFRIPCMVTLNDGTIVTASDARWNHAGDGAGLDTIVSYSKDNGKTWNYTFANYLGDNGNKKNQYSTSFIDPAIATDGETVYMIADLFPAGIALNTSAYGPVTGHTGYDNSGNLVLTDDHSADTNGDGIIDIDLNQDGSMNANDYVTKMGADGSSENIPYDYSLVKKDNATDEDCYEIQKEGAAVEGYIIDAWFNIKNSDGTVDTNLFCGDSPYRAWPTDYLYLTKSEDGGATWSAPMLISNIKTAEEATVLVCPGRATVVNPDFRTKRIIFPVYEHTSGREYTSVIYSDDNGVTWTRSANMSAASSEAGITEADGRLYLFTRHGGYYVSEDYGLSWSEKKTDVPAYDTGTQLSAITYSEKIDGKTAILLSVPGPGARRTNGKIYVILVDEETGSLEWKYDYDVTGVGVSFAYSCLSELEDGNVGILYEYSGSAITFESIAIEDIVGSAEVGSMWLTDAEGNVVETLQMSANETISLTVHGANTNVTVSSDNEAVTPSYADNAVTLTTAEEVEGLEVATVTVTSGNEVAAFKVEITNTERYEIVNLRMGDEKVFTDDSGNYADATNLDNVDTNIASVEVTDLAHEEIVIPEESQLQLSGDDNQFSGDIITASDSLYTLEADAIETKWHVSAASAENIYLEPYAGTNGYPNVSTPVEVTMSTGFKDGSFYIKNNSGYLYFAGNYDRVQSLGNNETYKNNCSFFLYRKAVGEETASTELPGYVKVSEVKAGEQYLILANYNDAFYALYPSLERTNKNTQYAQLTISEDGNVTAQRATGAEGNVIDECLYTFSVARTIIASGNSITSAKLSAETSDGTKVYFNLTNASPKCPSKALAEGASAPAIRINKKTNGFELNGTQGSMHFHTEETYPYFNKCNSFPSSGDAHIDQHTFKLYRPIKDGETSCEELWGYVEVTEITELENNGQYLIAHENNEGNLFVLHPSASNQQFEHIAKVVPLPNTVETTITIKGVAEGETSVTVGNVTYYINVENDEKEVVLNVGDRFTIVGDLQRQANDVASYIDLTEEVAFAPYEIVDKKVDENDNVYAEDGKYLIKWKSAGSKIMTNNSNDAGTRLAIQDVNLTEDDCSAYLWNITKVENGYHIQDENQKYLTIDTTSNNPCNVSVKSESDVLVITGYNNGYAIGKDEKYLNNYNSQGWVSTWSSDTEWYLYRATNNGCIIKAKEVGETSVTVGGVDYIIKVVSERDPEFNPKDLVIDFGLPVKVEYESINATLVKGTANYGKVDIKGDSASENWSVTYTPTTVLKKADTVTLTDGGNEYTFKVYPANNVYYEESFAEYTGNGWSVSEEKPATLQQGAGIGEEAYNYGYDAAYNSMTQTVAHSTEVGDLMEFEFTGTGVDVYANCEDNTGMMMIQVKVLNDNGLLEEMSIINTKLDVDAVLDTGLGNIATLKNVPFVSIAPGTLDHGKHYVKINHVKKNVDNTEESGIMIDGFRVYGTIDEVNNDEAAAVYTADGELNPTYVSIKENVVATVAANTTPSNTVAGAEVIYSENEKVYKPENVDAFKKNSSKNEIYLYPQQALVFSVAAEGELQIGMRALYDSVSYSVNNGEAAEMSSNLDMFYTVAPDTETGTVTITNTSQAAEGDAAPAILAITKLKVVENSTETTAVAFNALRPEDRALALSSLGYESVDSEGSGDDTAKDAAEVFEDINAGDWYEAAVQFVYNREIMSGHESLFRPNDNMTRAEVVTTLYRVAGEPEAADRTACEKFADVSNGSWYADAVCWAYSEGITTGISETAFGAEETATREQLATFLYRYASLRNMDVETAGDLATVKNGDAVSEFAKDAMEWAFGKELISGIDLGTEKDLAPQETATRAQLATVLMRFCEAYDL